jgi:uncharacterized cofD-like protein
MMKQMRQKEEVWYRRLRRFIHQELRWFTPGIGVKRWLGLILLGTTMLGVGIGMGLLEVYRTAPDTWWLPVLSLASLRFLDRPLRVLVFGLSGIGMVTAGIYGLNRSLLRPFIRPGEAVVDTVSAFRRRERGPRLVVIGGGTGLSALLRGLKEHTNNLTAIVTVADDGGSSGELRRSTGILPPGDIRHCLTALSDDEALLSQVFQYRFVSGAGLNGHSLGNLFITAMTDITGSFEEAVAEAGRVLAVKGRVLPATLHDVKLVASIQVPEKSAEIQITGESAIPLQRGKIRRVWLEPNNPLAFPPALQAILAADLIVIGPGSLFTSLLPNLLVPDLADAIRASRAYKFYVCNVATQPGETDGFGCGEHVTTLEKHLGGPIFDLVIINKTTEGSLPDGIEWVLPEQDLDQRFNVYQADLVDRENPWRHDSKKLAQTIMDLFYERTGPLTQRVES